MAQQKAIVDKLLSGVSAAYIPENFISEMIFPEVTVKQKTGKLGKYGTDHLRIAQTVIGGEGQYGRISTQVRSSDTYSIEGHGLVGVVTEDDYDNVEEPFEAESDEVVGISSVLMIGKEKGLADTLADTGVLTQNTTLSGTDQWNDYTNSDPIGDIVTGKKAVKAGCGFEPDTGIMGWDVAEDLRYHPALLDKLGYKEHKPGGLNDADLASALNLKRVLIGSAVYESAAKGQASSMAEIWGKHFILAKLPTKAAKYQVSLGYCFKMKSRPSRRVFKQPLFNPPNSKQILVDDHYDYVMTNIKAGYLIKNAVA